LGGLWLAIGKVCHGANPLFLCGNIASVGSGYQVIGQEFGWEEQSGDVASEGGRTRRESA
jgi:hypothetical protein